MPQLDTLRTFAVFLVLLEHWIPEGHWFKVLPYGMIGVTLFFVLSGFLITQILLRGRDIAIEKNQSRFHTEKQFYIRRTLRIFPIYYITIFILFIFNIQNIRETFLWYLFYASNIYLYTIQNWVVYLSHTWTLAVEEQFYIIWPFVILFIPKKYLFKAIIGIIILAPVFRTILFAFSNGTESAVNFIHILTPSCLDCFGLGAVLAYYRIKNEHFQFNSTKSIFFLIANILSIVILLFFEENLFSIFLFRFNVSLVCLFLISKVSIGFTGFLRLIFENKVLMYLGKISYGLYLFHTFIPLIYSYSGFPEINNLLIRFLVQFSMLVIIASLSWYLIEKPINNLKRYFAYN